MQTARSIQLWGTIVTLGLAPLFFGSVDQVWVVIWTIVLSICTICGAAGPLLGRRQRVYLYVFFALCGAYAFAAMLQVVPRLIDPLNDPIWQRARELLELDLAPRISSRAEIPPVAVGHFLLVLTSFTCGFFVGTSRNNTDVLFAFARYLILLYATYGLAALAFTPNMLLWAPKLAYQGSLTASFVNHNTAATFVGIGVILWASLAFRTAQSLNFSSLRILLLTPSYERIVFKLILRAAAALICFFALLLTRSRGGLICSSLGLVVAIGLMIANSLKPKFWYLLVAGSVALAVTLLWLSQMGRIGSQGLFDDGRWFVYEFCIAAIRDRPVLGAGAGTFGDLFPSFRHHGFDMGGVWEYAHSTILEIFFEMGIPIGVLVVLGAVASLLILGRSAMNSRNSDRLTLAATMGIAVLSYLHSAIDFSMQIPGYFIVFWILLGCGLARSSAEEPTRTGPRTRRIAL
ncbi:O-antigen ligase family protein [Bradyrhizobium diazoefficiens]|nr:O-antigen ligase family protein [Bradyrhizobium diazoefficiens]MBR0963762.1 O-antigen ligase family protein [Bradyrhizobium diazoefficiens]MBR0977914.1 O-antigen ligase family protein [Bradyrhizobium diazoefficiens]MBR1007424.1 O-antigen ligase family protein [Bradyrhizobium diazoefficiens]MBR1012735.1 O-antigen ligase family protein [Bradyrhizobium diazoefficiens]MBR1052283.1 O-antigen ligase family protein [Bradyrhizobium diazoefficiens]